MNPNNKEQEEIITMVNLELQKNTKSSCVTIRGESFTIVHHRPIFVLPHDIQCAEHTPFSRRAMVTLNLLLDNQENLPAHIIIFENDTFHVFQVNYQ